MPGIALGLGMDARRSVAALSPVAQAMAVLRKYGSDAHMYLPGIGYVNGADAGNWLDTAFAAPAVDSPVGLVMDAANTARGAELVTNGDFSSGTTGWTTSNGSTLSNVGGELVIAASGATNFPGANQTITTVVGRTYEVVFTGRRGTTSSSVGFAISNASPAYNAVFNATTSNVSVQAVFTATSTSVVLNPFIVGSPAVSGTVFFDNISAREVTGAIYASNNTTAQKPILMASGSGRYFWQFSASSSQRLVLSAAPFNLHDDHCVVSGVSIPTANTGVERTTVGLGGAANVLFRLYINGTGAPSGTWRTADLVSRQITAGSALPINSPRVLAVRKVGLNKTLWVDGVQQGATNTVDIPSTNLTLGALGSRADSLQFFDGSKHGDILIKGTVSDAQLLTLTRGLAALQGRALP